MWLIKPKAALYNAAAYIAGAVVVGSFLALIAAWVIFQWQECREAGMSMFYCIQHVL